VWSYAGVQALKATSKKKEGPERGPEGKNKNTGPETGTAGECRATGRERKTKPPLLGPADIRSSGKRGAERHAEGRVGQRKPGREWDVKSVLTEG